jgi:hypothetical protein
MPSDLSLETFANLLPDWVMAVLHPIDTCRRLLSITDERERIVEILKLFGVSATVSIVIYLPLSHKYGIEVTTAGFDTCYLLGFVMVFIACGFALHLGLRLRRIRSRLSDILAIYTAFFVCYQPLYVVASYYQTYQLFEFLNDSKHKGMYFVQAIEAYFNLGRQVATDLNVGNAASNVFGWALVIVLCISTALLVTTVAETCATTKRKAFSAISLTSAAILIPLSFVQWFVISYIVFAFMKG